MEYMPALDQQDICERYAQYDVTDPERVREGRRLCSLHYQQLNALPCHYGDGKQEHPARTDWWKRIEHYERDLDDKRHGWGYSVEDNKDEESGEYLGYLVRLERSDKVQVRARDPVTGKLKGGSAQSALVCKTFVRGNSNKVGVFLRRPRGRGGGGDYSAEPSFHLWKDIRLVEQRLGGLALSSPGRSISVDDERDGRTISVLGLLIEPSLENMSLGAGFVAAVRNECDVASVLLKTSSDTEGFVLSNGVLRPPASWRPGHGAPTTIRHMLLCVHALRCESGEPDPRYSGQVAVGVTSASGAMKDLVVAPFMPAVVGIVSRVLADMPLVDSLNALAVVLCRTHETMADTVRVVEELSVALGSKVRRLLVLEAHFAKPATAAQWRSAMGAAAEFLVGSCDVRFAGGEATIPLLPSAVHFNALRFRVVSSLVVNGSAKAVSLTTSCATEGCKRLASKGGTQLCPACRRRVLARSRCEKRKREPTAPPDDVGHRCSLL